MLLGAVDRLPADEIRSVLTYLYLGIFVGDHLHHSTVAVIYLDAVLKCRYGNVRKLEGDLAVVLFFISGFETVEKQEEGRQDSKSFFEEYHIGREENISFCLFV